jgi:hypothetical protein
MITPHRRSALLGGLSVAAALATGAKAAASEQAALKVSASRSTTATLWVPQAVRGVVLFSTGHGAWPERYDKVAGVFRDAGFAVVAPLHVDSVHYPQRDSFTREASFGERLADMRAAGALAADRWPGKPVAAVGHSFGSLTALCLGGALAELGRFRDPSVKAVLGYSTPGRIPGLVGPRAYAGLNLPAMIVTGDADVVPGLVSDPRDHLFPVASSPAGDKYGLVLAGGEHELIGGAKLAPFAAAAEAGRTFLQAFVLGDGSAKRRLAVAAGPGEQWIRR